MNLITKLAAPLALLGLAAACRFGAPPTATRTPPPTLTPTPSPTPLGPTPLAPTHYELPTESTVFPLDLVPLQPDNVGRLEPFQAVSDEGLPDSIVAASLAFPVFYQFEVAGLLDDGQLVIWNMATGEVSYRDLEGDAARQMGQHPALAVSTGFRGFLATGGTIRGIGEAQAVVVRTADEDREPLLFSGASDAFTPDSIEALDFSPDGNLLAAGLAAGEDGLVKVWDVGDENSIQPVSEVPTDGPVSAVAFTSDGSVVLASAGDTVVEIQVQSGIEQGRQAYAFPVEGLAVGSEGEALAVWGVRQAVLDIPGLSEPLEIPTAGVIRRVDFSPDGRLALLVDGQRLRLWDLEAASEVVSLRGDESILDGRFFADGRVLATIDSQSRLLLWGVRSDVGLPFDRPVILPANVHQLERVARLYAPTGPGLHFLPNSDRVTIDTAHGVFIVDVASLEAQRLLSDTRPGGTTYAHSPDGRWIAWVGEQDGIRIWSLARDRVELEISAQGEFCCVQLLFTPDGQHLITTDDRSARVWDIQTGAELRAFDFVQKLHVSPDGSLLALQQGLEVNLVDIESGQVVRTLTGFETAAPIINTQFSPAWETMAWTSRATMQFSDVESGALGPAVPFSWGVFSPLGDSIAAVEDGWILQTVGEVHEIDVHSGQTLRVYDHQEDAIVDALAYSSDGRLLVTASENSVRVWDAQSGEQLLLLPGSSEGVYEVSFAPDQRLLVTVSSGDMLEFWAVGSEQ